MLYRCPITSCGNKRGHITNIIASMSKLKIRKQFFDRFRCRISSWFEWYIQLYVYFQHKWPKNVKNHGKMEKTEFYPGRSSRNKFLSRNMVKLNKLYILYWKKKLKNTCASSKNDHFWSIFGRKFKILKNFFMFFFSMFFFSKLFLKILDLHCSTICN